uniref:NR LBD domain-containing protein n=1 Tax=Ascaris lumbricoides TaxID=6252 RepID=A0A0M3HYA8_ASCLU
MNANRAAGTFTPAPTLTNARVITETKALEALQNCLIDLPKEIDFSVLTIMHFLFIEPIIKAAFFSDNRLVVKE